MTRSFARAGVKDFRATVMVSQYRNLYVHIMYVRTMYRLLRRLGPFFGLTEGGVCGILRKHAVGKRAW